MDYARYVVQPGDTIYKIAQAYQVDMNEIIRLNQLKHPDRIYPGQVILLPTEETSESMPMEIPEPNFTYAMWLFDLYAGHESVLTSMTTYLYQSIVLEQPEFDNLIRPIILDKITHLSQLGMCLCRLGVDPRYGSFQRGRWVDWRSGYVKYMTELCPILSCNMEMETAMAKCCLELCERIPIPEIQSVLSQIAADCQRHCQCFAEMKQKCCPEDMYGPSHPMEGEQAEEMPMPEMEAPMPEIPPGAKG